MFKNKKNNTKNNFQSQRKPRDQLDRSFSRNTVVISKSQRELKAHQQSVTQRQHDLFKMERQKARKVRIGITLSLLAGVAIFLRLQIGNISVAAAPGYVLPPGEGAKYVNTLSELAPKYTAARQLWLLDDMGLEKAIKRKHPEISAVRLNHKAPLSATLRADLSFRKPVFAWGGADKQTRFVDRDGILFDTNRVRGISTADLVRIEDQSGVVLDQGSSVLTSSLIEFVGSIPQTVEKVFPDREQINIQRVVIPQSIREVHVKFSDSRYLVKLSANRPLLDQVKELRSLRRFLEGRGVNPRSYVDLRTPLKAYYK